MARRRRKLLLITDEAQREAITSPVRLEVLEHLGVVGPASVRVVAERMERTPHAVHYHVRRLLEVGLIVQTGSRKSGPRDEAIYDVVADRLEVPASVIRESDDLETKALRAILRRAERDFTTVAATDPARLTRRGGFAGRLQARLSDRARKAVIGHLEAIQTIFAEELRREPASRAKTEACSLTAVFVPEVRRPKPGAAIRDRRPSAK